MNEMTLANTCCAVCANQQSNNIFLAAEKMFGLGGEFKYLECSNCGMLQNLDVPDNLDEYYPESYYAYSGGNQIKRFLKKHHARYCFGHTNLLGWILSKRFAENKTYWVKRIDAELGWSILDVGCGNGEFLQDLSMLGFTNLTGMDPYIETRIEGGINYAAETLQQHLGQYDLVTMHHVLEHLPDPDSVFQELSRLVKAGGCLLVRTPHASSEAFRKYKENWFNLDAPRHLFIYTTKGFEILAARHGFAIEEVYFDSTSMQFIGSELYTSGLTLADKPEFFRNHLSRRERKIFRKESQSFNKQKVGDTFCVSLRRL